jgi:hypothetical protein
LPRPMEYEESSRGTRENFYTMRRAVAWYAKKILYHGIIYTKLEFWI